MDKRKTTTKMIASFIAVLMIAVIACGGDVDEPATALPGQSSSIVDAFAADEPVAEDQQKLESAEADAAAKPNAEDKRVASAIAVHPEVEPEPGSDEAAIIEAYERTIQAIRARDFVAYVDACATSKRRISVDQTEFVFNSIWDEYLNVAGMTQREVTVRTFKDDTAFTESVMYEFDEVFVERFSYGFSKLDGVCYATTNCQV